MNANGDAAEEMISEESAKWMKLRVDDMNFVLDELKKGSDENDLNAYWFANESLKKDSLEALGLIDTDKIGVMGHSMGGATAVEIGLERDDIDAVIDIDGTMLGSIKGAKDGKYIIEDVEYHVPLFELKNEESYYELTEIEKMDYPYPNFVIRDNADVYYGTYFEGSLHMDYTDLPLFSPFLAKILGSGNVDNAYMMDRVNSLAVSFFDCYLKGEGQFSVNESYPGVR
jgi:pimeloyl-ACP methyl ester carboxylesterase